MDIKGSRINKFQAVFFGIALSYKIRANQSRPENNDDVDDVSPGIIRACIWGPYGALPLAPLSVLAGHCVRLSYCLLPPIIIVIIIIITIQGGRTWQPCVGSENENENFRQMRIYNFRV